MKLLDWLKSRWYIFLLTDTPEWRCREVYYDEQSEKWVTDIFIKNPADPHKNGTEDLDKAITYIDFLKGE